MDDSKATSKDYDSKNLKAEGLSSSMVVLCTGIKIFASLFTCGM